jgi:uncharacterized protein
MTPSKRWLLVSLGAILALCALALALAYVSANFLVEVWWFDSVGYGAYFWQRYLYKYAVFASAGIVFFLIFFLNFWAASRHLGATPQPVASSTGSSFRRYRELIRKFRTGSLGIYTPLSAVLAVVVALPLFREWESFLLYVFAPRTGVADPVYHQDISYYLFSYPIFTLIQNRLLVAFFVLLAGLVFLYWLERRLLARQEARLPRGARIHLGLLILFVFLIEVWDFILQRDGLVYTGDHMPLFYGPGYVEMNVILPLIWMALVALAAAGVAFVYYVNARKGLKVVLVCAGAFAAILGLRYSGAMQQSIQKYLVKPNETAKERPYIENNIAATLAAYGLTGVEIRDFNPQRMLTDLEIPGIKDILRNTPVWDREMLDDVFKQLQELRTYYDFPAVDVDRYTVNNVYQQVFLSARELNYGQVPEGARNWVNSHLSYTHGYGAVMTPAGQGGDEPIVWFLKGIPPESEYGFQIEQPGIYFGQMSNPYVIAPNGAGEIDYPKGSANVMTSYRGKGGVPVHSLLRRFIFAVYYQDRNILFTSNTTPDSRMLFRQNITERIRDLTPFLALDGDPYLVVTPKRFYWIQDAYTTSDRYPASAPTQLQGRTVNYVRNAVKVVLDAYDGSVDYYVFDPKDPIITAYSRIYPGLFKEAGSMPDELKRHVRYPQDIFELQMSVYNKYHQTDPEVFYQYEDVWEFARTYAGREPVGIKPYYVTLDLVQPGKFEFLSLLPLSPKGRDNLRALALVECDPAHYGKIIVYNFPKGDLVYGPSQIYALINQDTKISEQFTLWDQAGSQVARGKMIILPISGVILYIQPVYLVSSTQLKIPELKRLIVSQGQMVVMEPSLEDSYAKLRDRIRTEVERVDKRFAPLLPGAPPAGTPPAGAQEAK